MEKVIKVGKFVVHYQQHHRPILESIIRLLKVLFIETRSDVLSYSRADADDNWRVEMNLLEPMMEHTSFLVDEILVHANYEWYVFLNVPRIGNCLSHIRLLLLPQKSDLIQFHAQAESF